MPPQERPIKYWVIIFLLLLYIIPVSFLVFKNFIGSNLNGVKMAAPEGNPLFSTQIATIKGKIDRVNGNNISVTNLEGLTGVLTLSDKLLIMDMQNPTATLSGDLKKIQTGKDALIVLSSENGDYTVTDINFQAVPFIIPSSQQTGQNPSPPKTSSAPAPLLLPSFSPPVISTISGNR